MIKLPNAYEECIKIKLSVKVHVFLCVGKITTEALNSQYHKFVYESLKFLQNLTEI